jgi:hypothetical protein
VGRCLRQKLWKKFEITVLVQFVHIVVKMAYGPEFSLCLGGVTVMEVALLKVRAVRENAVMTTGLMADSNSMRYQLVS